MTHSKNIKMSPNSFDESQTKCDSKFLNNQHDNP